MFLTSLQAGCNVSPKKRKTGRDYRFPRGRAVNEHLTPPFFGEEILFILNIDVLAVVFEEIVVEDYRNLLK